MIIAEPSFTILSDISTRGKRELQLIERAGRVCYKSEDKIERDGSSAEKFVRNIIKLGHETVLEHSSLTVLFTVDRAVANELVRHRIASYCQESTRYCNYDKDKFYSQITFIRPSNLEEKTTEWYIWRESCLKAEKCYKDLIADGVKPEDARSVLPVSTKTDIVVTANYREWRHVLRTRTDTAAHPDIRKIMSGLLLTLQNRIPIVFDDIYMNREE